MTYRSALAAAVVLMLAGASPVAAHVFGAAGAGLGAGLAHPFTGVDHLLAMIAVGFWAAQIGGRTIAILPLAFPAAMAIGAILGAQAVPLPAVEIGIAASVVVLGTVVALGLRPPLASGAALVGLFAVLHGHAHGTELPEAASPLVYGLGFLLATIILHGTGVAGGLMLRRSSGPLIGRLIGSGIAAAGVGLLAQLS